MAAMWKQAMEALDDSLSDGAIARIRTLIEPFVLRRLKSEVLQQLVKKEEKMHMIDMLPDQRVAYDEVVRAFTERRAAGKGKLSTKNVCFNRPPFF